MLQSGHIRFGAMAKEWDPSTPLSPQAKTRVKCPFDFLVLVPWGLGGEPGAEGARLAPKISSV